MINILIITLLILIVFFVKINTMICYICNKNKDPIFCLSGKLLCVNHSKILFNEKITIIQKIYRGYKMRRYLKNIFNRLPRDLQIHILDYNIKNNKSIYINKNLYKICYKINSFVNIRAHTITLKELSNILAFLIKYKSFIDYKWKNYYCYYFKNICYILILIINLDTFPNNINYVPSYISISIYNSLNFQPNIDNDDFSIQVNKLQKNIYVFLNTP